MNFFVRLLFVCLSSGFLFSCTPDSGSGETGEAARTGQSIEPYRYDKCLVINLPLDFHGKEIRKVHDSIKICIAESSPKDS